MIAPTLRALAALLCALFLPLVAAGQDVTPIGSVTTGLTGPDRNTAGADRLLIFVASMEGNGNRTITSVTYGTRPLTEIVTDFAGQGTRNRVYLFYLKEAEITQTTHNDFAINWSGPVHEAHYTAGMFANVDQNSPIRDTASASTDNSSPNPLVALAMTALSGDMAVAAAVSGKDGDYSWNNNFVEQSDQSGSTSTHSSARRSITANGSYSASATHSGPNRQALVAAVLSKINEPTIYYVRPDGSDSNSGTGASAAEAWRTLTHATTADELIPGDIVHIMPGTYSGTINPTVDGSSGQPIRFIADRSGTIFGTAGDVTLKSSSDDEAIHLSDDDYLEFVGFRIEGDGSSQETVEVDNCNGIMFESCEIFGGGGDGIDANASSVTMINCLIHDNGGEGIHLRGGTLIAWNCTIANNQSDGVQQDDGTLTITNSIVADNSFTGLERNSGTMNHSYNLLHANPSGPYAGTSAGTGEIAQDPLFVSTSDFHLQPGSPAINAGTDASGTVDEDFDGNSRPVGSGWEFGCYEYLLLGQWKLDEGGGFTTVDSSGNGHDGTLQGAATWEAARCGQAVVLDGSSAWVDLGQIELGTTAYTISAWFKSSQAATQTIAAATASGTTDHLMFVQLDANGHVQLVHRGPPDSSGGTTLTSTDTYHNGHWHHVAAVKSASELRLYVDGALVGQAADTTSVHSSVDLVLGRYGTSLSQHHFQGSLDEVLLSGTALSLTEVAALAGVVLHWKLDSSSGSVAIDSSVLGRDGTVSGSPIWQPDSGRIDGALKFEGGSDQVENAGAGEYLNGLTEITVSLWVKSDNTNIDQGIFFTDDPNGGDNRLGMRYDKDGWAGGGTDLIKVSLQTTEGETAIESSSQSQSTSWQHLAFIWRSGESLQLYIDGTLDTPSDDAGPLGGSVTGVTKLLLGVATKSIHWDGLIDDLRIYDRALCTDEIEDLFQGGSPQGVRIIRWVEKK